LRKPRILVTGAGGVGGVNFIKALRLAGEYFIVGMDYDEFYLQLPEVDVRFKSPRHDMPEFIELVKKMVKKYRVEFIHPQPEAEVEVLAEKREELRDVGLMIPKLHVVKLARDKWESYKAMTNASVNLPETKLYSIEAVSKLLEKYEKVWIRARKGAGGRLSLPVKSLEEAELWVKLWCTRGLAQPNDFIVQEYLPGRDVAWDSLWFRGELIASYSRERLRYIFPHLSPSRITGTPTVSRIIKDPEVNTVARSAVLAIDPKPHGFYCVDLKYNSSGRPAVTEVNVKAHTTLGLWSYVAQRILGLPREYNLPYLYIELGLGRDLKERPEKYDIYPEAIMIRHIDADLLINVNGVWRRVGP